MGTAVAETVRRESASGVQVEKCIVITEPRARWNLVEEIEIWSARYTEDVDDFCTIGVISILICLCPVKPRAYTGPYGLAVSGTTLVSR